MDVYDYTIDDLIVNCSEKMKESGYSQSCISVHTVRWKLHVKPFLSKNETNIYSHDLGRKFLMENLNAFSSFKEKLKHRITTPKEVSLEVMQQIESLTELCLSSSTEIIERHQSEAYMNYVFPTIKRRNPTQS